jgi:hypothetical protein
MKLKLRPLLACVIGFGAMAAAPAAFAWGARGHEMISAAAVEGLSADVPAFLRTRIARDQVSLLGRESDRSRGAGKTHDAERDSGHYINTADDGTVAGLFPLSALPLMRWQYDKAINAAGAPYPGYLPYAEIDAYQQVVKDFAYWRTSKIASRNAKSKADRDWFAAELKLREMIIIRDIGFMSHFVADASQPLHVSVHSYDWDAYPDPMTYPPPGQPKEISSFHSYYEGPFVKAHVTPAALKAAMTPYRPCDCAVEQRVAAFIAATLAQVKPLFAMVQAGDVKSASPAAVAFTTARLAAGASETRDMIEDAWRASATSTVGWPNINVADVESGKVILTRDSYGSD